MMLQPVVLALGVLIMNSPQQVEPTKPPTELVHVSNTFNFEVPASLGRVAPFFGPEADSGSSTVSTPACGSIRSSIYLVEGCNTSPLSMTWL